MGRNRYFSLIVITLLLALAIANENCQISEAELSRISEILTHMDKPIYTEEEFDNESEECTYMLNNIYMQLRRLTHRYKLMNKEYVKVEEFQKMAKEYDDQLLKLNKELEYYQEKAQSNASQKLQQLKEKIKQLEQEVHKSHRELKGISAEYGKVKMELCITYLQSNQMSKAKDKVKQLESRYLVELIQTFLNTSTGSVLPVIDFSSAIPDLDDRGEAYKTIYNFIKSTNRMQKDDSLLLEAEIQKMNATFKPGSKITDERKNELQQLLNKLGDNSKSIFEKWTNDLNQSVNFAVIKNALDRMFLTQMADFGDTVTVRSDYNSVRNLMKLLVISNNYYKIAAYRKLIENKIGHTLAMIMFDMLSMESTELKVDSHIPDEIEKLYNVTFDSLPNSLRNILPCLKNVHIYHESHNQNPDQCIVATNNPVEVKHPKLGNTFGHFKRVITKFTECTRFRLEPTYDKASVKLVSSEGNGLTNINTAIPETVWFSHVGAPYTNSRNMKLDSSQEWILDANFDNDTMKIESEFNVYKMGKTVDHLLVQSIGGVPHVVVGRYGVPGLRRNSVEKFVDWKFMCAH